MTMYDYHFNQVLSMNMDSKYILIRHDITGWVTTNCRITSSNSNYRNIVII